MDSNINLEFDLLNDEINKIWNSLVNEHSSSPANDESTADETLFSLFTKQPITNSYETQESFVIHESAAIVLIHASLEYRLENIVTGIVDLAIQEYEQYSKISKLVIYLLMFFPLTDKGMHDKTIGAEVNEARKKHYGNLNNNIEVLHAESVIGDKLEYSYLEWQKIVDNNNGIRTNNLQKLLKPLGFKKKDFKNANVEMFDALGAQRGDFAHKPYSLAIQNLQNSNSQNVQDIRTNIDMIIKSINECIIPDLERLAEVSTE